MRRVMIKGLLAHKLRLALTAVSVVLGVGFVAGTFVLTDTLAHTFDSLFAEVNGNTDAQIRSTKELSPVNPADANRGPIPDSLLAAVQKVDGVAEVTVAGAEQPAIRVRANPMLLSSIGLSVEDASAAGTRPRSRRRRTSPPRPASSGGPAPRTSQPGLRNPIGRSGRWPSQTACRSSTSIRNDRCRPNGRTCKGAIADLH